MPGGEDVTLGEVARNLEALAKQMERGFERVDDRFNTLAMVHADVYLADRAADSLRHQGLADRVSRIESGQQWLARTIGAVIVTLVAGAIWALAGLRPPH